MGWRDDPVGGRDWHSRHALGTELHLEKRVMWKPIDTAPRDGTRFLAQCYDPMVISEHRMIEVRGCRWGLTSQNSWRERWIPDFRGTHFYPTHWQPIPT